MKSRLVLHALELNVFLGWPDAENAQQQLVSVDIEITFSEPPAACFSDDLRDTFSYDTLIEAIIAKTATKKYRLLEHLSYALHQLIQLQVPPTALVDVAVKKFPAIPALKGGASFCFGE
jgi:FolB domain-containing protein